MNIKTQYSIDSLLNPQAMKEVLAHIGFVTVRLSNLDFFLNDFLNKLVNPKIPGIGNFLTTQLSFSQKLDRIKKITNFYLAAHPNESEMLSSILSDSKKYSQIRNVFAHGLWIFAEDSLNNRCITCMTSKVHEKKIQNGIRVSFREMHEYKFDELENISAELGYLCDRANTLFQKIVKILPQCNQ